MFIFFKKTKKGQCVGGDAVSLGFVIFFRERALSLLDSGQSDRRFLIEQEVKLLYAVRTTRGHRFGGVPTTPRGRDLFLLVLIFG